MKDLKRFLFYGTASGLVILLLTLIGRSEAISGGIKVSLALILVVVLPLFLGVFIAKKEHREKTGH
jgi:hypothetical protein